MKAKKKEKITKQHVILVIIILLVLVFGGLVAWKISYSPVNNYSYSYPKSGRAELVNCLNSTKCYTEQGSTFDMLKVDYKSDLLQDAVKKINKETKELYEKEKNSLTKKDKECSAVKGTYRYRYDIENVLEIYENDEFYSIASQRVIADVCNGDYERKPFDIYILDKKTNKLIDQKEFTKRVGVTYDMVYSSIKKTAEMLKKYGEDYIVVQDKYDEYKVFYDSTGDLEVAFYSEGNNSYNYVPIQNGKN